CGLLSWRARFLQRFAAPKWFLVFQCWLVLAQGLIVSGMTGVVISSLEKRFYLKTSEVGAITACYDIAAALMAIVVSYYGHHHKPKWLGSGALILGIGCFLFALPHLLVGDYEPGTSVSDFCDRSPNPSALSSVKCQSSIWYHILVFVIAEFFIGFGATPVYILGTAFIDENVRHATSGLFLGIMYAVAAFGPAVGYLLGGQFLNIYVDIEQPSGVDLKPEDSNWIGAWWLGYVFGGTLALLCSFPLLMFPYELPGTREIRAEKQALSDTVEDPNTPHTLKQLLPALRNLLTNPTFVFLSLAAAFEGLAVGGFSTFLPKFMEAQFRMTASDASFYAGIITVPGGVLGMLVGGLLVKKMNWTCGKTIKACIFIATVAFLFTSILLFGCQNREFMGITRPYMNSTKLGGSMDAPCNLGCRCRAEVYAPLCTEDDQMTYYSACFAGSTGSRAIKGSGCKPDCSNIYPFMVGLALLMFTTFLNNIPATTATLRCIPESQGSFGLGIQQLIVRILAFIPAPIVFGAAIDVTCRMPQKDACDPAAERNCLEYDTDKFRYVMLALGGTFKLLSAISFFLAWKYYKLPPKDNKALDNVVENSIATELEN
ncbi:predicted protein, partial [Nematostella vectensis]